MPGRRRLIFLKVLQVVVSGLIAAAAYIREAGPPVQNPPGLRAHLYAEFVAWYVLIMVGLVVIGTLAQAWAYALGSEEKTRVRGALDALIRACYPDVAEQEQYHNRATLFQARRPMLGGHKLRGYARSGTAFQRGIPDFTIDDNAEGANEGVAGRAWFTNATAHVVLPEWSGGAADQQAYASAGYLTVAKADKLRVPSRSLFAVPVRDLQGRRWGVLVVDSRRAEPFTAAQQGLIKTFAGALGTMV